MPPPGAGKGNWGSKPGVSEAAAEGAATAAQGYREARYQELTAQEQKVMDPLRSSCLGRVRKNHALDVACAALTSIKKGHGIFPPCSKGCTCKNAAGRQYDFLCQKRSRKPSQPELGMQEALTVRLRDFQSYFRNYRLEQQRADAPPTAGSSALGGAQLSGGAGLGASSSSSQARATSPSLACCLEVHCTKGELYTPSPRRYAYSSGA